MPVAFSRTTRSLDDNRGRIALILVLVSGSLLGVWFLWMITAKVTIYGLARSARVETQLAIHPIQSLYSGRISANYLVLGQEVKRGDVLLELDANVQMLELTEQEREGASIEGQISALQREILADRRALADDQSAAEIGVEEARAHVQEAEAGVALATADADRLSKMQAAGLVPKVDLARALAEDQKQKAAANSLKLSIDRLRREQRTRASERQSHIEELTREVARLSGLSLKEGATIDRLRSEVQLRSILAPVDGKIGEIANLRVGSIVHEGEQLGAIIPAGTLKVVAQFDPATALGRVHEGQRARVRLDGFPWAQFGTVNATVATVANEVRDGTVRVDLTLLAGTPVPLQHGLPGKVEVEIEKISPAALLLRVAGQSLTSVSPQP
jgi:membrane fusion protein (multidrug efflux system)